LWEGGTGTVYRILVGEAATSEAKEDENIKMDVREMGREWEMKENSSRLCLNMKIHVI